MIAYRKRLQEQLSKLGLEQAGVYAARIPLYETISDILDKRGAIFAPHVSELFRGIIATERAATTTDLARYGALIGKDYGINVISLNEAISNVYGRNFIYKNRDRHVNKTTSIFYKSTNSLDKFIRKHTSKLELIIIDCDFPKLINEKIK